MLVILITMMKKTMINYFNLFDLIQAKGVDLNLHLLLVLNHMIDINIPSKYIYN